MGFCTAPTGAALNPPARAFCSGASARLNPAGNRWRKVLCNGAGDAASVHSHGCRTTASTAFPTALPILGSCWQSQSDAAALHTSRAEGYLSIAMTSAGALLLPLWVRHGPDLVKRLRRRSAELLSLSVLTAPSGFNFKGCTHSQRTIPNSRMGCKAPGDPRTPRSQNVLLGVAEQRGISPSFFPPLFFHPTTTRSLPRAIKRNLFNKLSGKAAGWLAASSSAHTGPASLPPETLIRKIRGGRGAVPLQPHTALG